MVTFKDPDADKEEEYKIKSLGAPAEPSASEGVDGVDGGVATAVDDVDVEEDEDGGSAFVAEKSMMPKKRTEAIAKFYVSVWTLQTKCVGPFIMSGDATVDDLKESVEETEGMKMAQQLLFFEIPKRSGSVVGGGAAKVAPGVPATQIQGWQPSWPRSMQKRPLRKGRGFQKLSELMLGEGFEKKGRPADAVAFTCWLVPRPPGAADDDHDDGDIETENLAEASAFPGNLALRKRDEKPKSKCSVM